MLEPENQWRYFYVIIGVEILTLQLWIQIVLISTSWERGLSILEYTTG